MDSLLSLSNLRTRLIGDLLTDNGYLVSQSATMGFLFVVPFTSPWYFGILFLAAHHYVHERLFKWERKVLQAQNGVQLCLQRDKRRICAMNLCLFSLYQTAPVAPERLRCGCSFSSRENVPCAARVSTF